MQWHFEEHQGTGVLHLSGFLGERVVHRFQGAFAWARARSEVALILDLTDLLGWSPHGRAAIVDAARQWDRHHTPLAICSLRAHLARQLPTGSGPEALRLHPDLPSALKAVAGHGSATSSPSPPHDR